jgi:hypothetical protein
MTTIILDDKNYVNDDCYHGRDLGIILMMTMVTTKVDTTVKGIL